MGLREQTRLEHWNLTVSTSIIPLLNLSLQVSVFFFKQRGLTFFVLCGEKNREKTGEAKFDVFKIKSAKIEEKCSS